jgi:hypothetical protein
MPEMNIHAGRVFAPATERTNWVILVIPVRLSAMEAGGRDRRSPASGPIIREQFGKFQMINISLQGF